MRAYLALEDGSVYVGKAFGATGETAGEVVFNTSMTGYQEVLTDPSYAGQIVTMTYPLIGNYGIAAEDFESPRPQVAGFVVREHCRRAPATGGLKRRSTSFLERHGILGIEGVDTRALTRRIRVWGAMRGVLSTECDDPEELVRRARAVPAMEGLDLVQNGDNTGELPL
ncbi:MAG: hypothetical protein KatS3mg115_2110 [Candidatus Poribacteria bacterium]|nr:MAG: hypothetical protein KatS3mg115_2110 [Candidatus Poribacteria bacterium]